MKNLKDTFLNMSEVAVGLIIVGTKLSIGILLVGILVFFYNKSFVADYGTELLSIQIVLAAWNLFVIIILGGIALDCFQRR